MPEVCFICGCSTIEVVDVKKSESQELSDAGKIGAVLNPFKWFLSSQINRNTLTVTLPVHPRCYKGNEIIEVNFPSEYVVVGACQAFRDHYKF